MQPIRCSIGCLILLTVSWAGLAADKPVAKNDLPRSAVAAKQKLLSAGQLAGTITEWDSEQRSFTLSVPLVFVLPVDDGEGGITLELREESENITLDLTDDAIVRRQTLPPAFDEKGRPRKYSREEVKLLKGNPKLPGYKADLSDLKVDQVIQVSLSRKKGEMKLYASMIVIRS